MRIPLSLIKSFVPLDISLTEISETLTLLGIEVDAILNERPPFSGIVVGKVVSAKPHPDAKTLRIAEVSDGKQAIQVVCGAENCRAGTKVPFAKVGAILTDGQGKERAIERTSLRGVDSHGMLCSASELQLWEDNTGLLELPDEWREGDDLTKLLWDPVFELSLTPNLGHCLSALGIARELSAALQKKMHRQPVLLTEQGSRFAIDAAVRDAHLCPRYMCRRIEGITIEPSPFWLKKILLSCGMKSINNAVDIANYIMLKMGQPLHCFDADRIEGGIEIAAAKSAEKFVGLDGIEREIAPGALLIRDAKKTIAIAGVMGSADSAVSPQTKNIVLEAAFFDPMTIRKGAKKVGLRTESAIRFEKGVDPNGVADALEEAALLLAELGQGHVCQGKIDIKKHPFPPKKIPYRPDRVNQLLGTKLSQTEMEEIFQRLHFQTDAAEVHVPAYRFDISEEIDLIEEIARIYGYNNIEKRAPLCIPSQIPHDPVYLFETKVRRTCAALGLQEFLTADLISPKLAHLALEFAAPKISLLHTLHPKTEEYSILRPSLLPGLLHVAKGNIDKKNASFRAFEMGRIHLLQERKNLEIPSIALILTGKIAPPSWNQKAPDADFYDLKGILEQLFESLSIAPPLFEASKHLSFHPGRQTDIRIGASTIGSCGEIHPKLLETLDIKQRVFFAELNLLHLLSLHRPRHQMAPIPQYPSSERDWTISLSLDAPIESILQKIHAAAPSLLEKVELIDLYHPEHAPQKNATFRFTYRDRLKTISFDEVESAHNQILSRVSAD